MAKFRIKKIFNTMCLAIAFFNTILFNYNIRKQPCNMIIIRQKSSTTLYSNVCVYIIISCSSSGLAYRQSTKLRLNFKAQSSKKKTKLTWIIRQSQNSNELKKWPHRITKHFRSHYKNGTPTPWIGSVNYYIPTMPLSGFFNY